MKRLIPKFNLFLVLLLLLLGCSNLDPSSKPQKSWLFAHIAIQAEILNETTIVMPVTGKIIAFTTEPFHKHAALSGEQFALLMLDAESKSFKTGPRNAVLSWLDEQGMQEVLVVVTGAKASATGKSITYTTEAMPNWTGSVALTSPHLYLDRYYAARKHPRNHPEFSDDLFHPALMPKEFRF